MEHYQNQHFTGERALFQTNGARIDHCLFDDGESPLKESANLIVDTVTFGWKYPLWYDKNVKVSDSDFLVGARAGVWYTDNASFLRCNVEAPKMFRKCRDLSLSNVEFVDAAETIWSCEGVTLSFVKAKNADYFGYHCNSLRIDGLELEGKYIFDTCEDIIIKNSRLMTKDAFWNCRDVTCENCYIDGEYFGWNSENITLINCEIHSHQGFCYMKNVKLVNCKLIDTDLCFEYCSNIEVECTTPIDSVKNPLSGTIKAPRILEMIRDDDKVDHSKTKVIVGEGQFVHEI
ncbi:MAG: DUF3737 family protein [Bacilli bacterium]|nr:DUF3737 family protein [Bacilli bacterium]